MYDGQISFHWNSPHTGWRSFADGIQNRSCDVYAAAAGSFMSDAFAQLPVRGGNA
jgi:hypothetical protein